MYVGPVGQLNQQCIEDQQLRAHSFLLWRTALNQQFSNFSASESPGELVKPETAGPQPQKFWFSRSGLRSKNLSLLTSFPGDVDLGTIHWEQLSRLTSITCPRGSWEVLPSRVTDWLKAGVWKSSNLAENHDRCVVPPILLRSTGEEAMPRLWLTFSFHQGSSPTQCCLPHFLQISA